MPSRNAALHESFPEPGIDHQVHTRVSVGHAHEEMAESPLRAAKAGVVDQDTCSVHGVLYP
jgi:hypothetical protein